jgi:hypothetical protein
MHLILVGGGLSLGCCCCRTTTTADPRCACGGPARPNAYQCISMHINAYQCISMHINAYQCISMHINAYQCSGRMQRANACMHVVGGGARRQSDQSIKLAIHACWLSVVVRTVLPLRAVRRRRR